jgi:hypothetical protein
LISKLVTRAWIRVHAHEQEYQAKGQESQELELAKRSQVFPQDVFIAHDFLDQDTQVFHVHETRCLTRVQIFYPFSQQLYPNDFPGLDPDDCPRDLAKHK